MTPTIQWTGDSIRLIDQTRLPGELAYVECRDLASLWRAIRTLTVRGAPALGAAGALGVYLAVKDSKAGEYESLRREIDEACEYLGSSRPTAVNLFWAMDRMQRCARSNSRLPAAKIKSLLLEEALAVMEEDRAVCRRIGAGGAELLADGQTVLTHCNAGALATVDFGTALGVIYAAKETGKRIKVYVDETRPLLQGARLTAWELMDRGIDATLICDNAAAAVMAQGKIDAVIVGADRIAANGDTANKIGTYSVAVLASHHRIPFYVAAPASTFDLAAASGRAIPIEERPGEELTESFGRRTAPKGVKTYTPAFDVTPGELVSAFITERGVIRPPFAENIPAAIGVE